MGFKEELREQGHSEDAIAKAISQIEEDYRTEERPPDFERIKEELSKRKNPSIVNLKRLNMVSNPPKLEELKELGRKHWKEHRPKLFKELQESEYLEEALDNAAKFTLDGYLLDKEKLLKRGDTPSQAHETAWELVREEWLLRPSEDQPELESPPRS